MSIFLVDLVLKVQLPPDMQSRAAKKLVLVCLANVCHNDDGINCYPSRATLARAAERTERTIDAFLADLASRGFIEATDIPRWHRPRTWRLQVDRLLDLQPVARLTPSQDLQQGASLTAGDARDERVLDRQFQPVDLQFQNLDSQLSRLDRQPVATERNELSLERSEQTPTGTRAPQLSDGKTSQAVDVQTTPKKAADNGAGVANLGATITNELKTPTRKGDTDDGDRDGVLRGFVDETLDVLGPDAPFEGLMALMETRVKAASLRWDGDYVAGLVFIGRGLRGAVGTGGSE